MIKKYKKLDWFLNYLDVNLSLFHAYEYLDW